jgi:hypothetical protein
MGNNDGIIAGNNEGYPFWQHLSEARLIKWNPIRTNTAQEDLRTAAAFCANSSGKPILFSPPDNNGLRKYLPPAIYDSSFVYATSHRYTIESGSICYQNATKNNLFLLTDYSGGEPGISTRKITVNQLFQMDSKIDDGKPDTGDIRDSLMGTLCFLSSVPDNPPCTTSGVTPKAYDLSPSTADTPSCTPAFMW